MIPKLYDKTGLNLIGELNDLIECKVTEERNGQFELSLIYPASYAYSDYFIKENIIVANGNDTLLNQKFRIYNIKKRINKRIQVYARHISYDLAYDYINTINIANQSCEYALNQLFRNSQFSNGYTGVSDIVNTQNYSVSKLNILEAIGGSKGSILDTFGTGAEILRDNTKISVLNSRGHDNSVTIEYKKNLTGFELEEDISDVCTRVIGYAKSTPNGGVETIVETGMIDSPLVNNYSHPYIKRIDFSEQFQDEVIPTVESLTALVNKKFALDKIDIPKFNYKLEFIPLSKCLGYEGLEDKISLCDKVTVINSIYNINTQAKVIKVIYNVLIERYESMELGEPKTTLGDIVSTDAPKQGPQGSAGPPGKDGESFPDTLPVVPTLTFATYGFGSIELNWTFENKVYYTYELYASRTKDFIPNTMDLICEGQVSSFLFEAIPGETWYFKVCGKNSYGNRTAFSTQVTVTTTKIADLSNYVGEASIGNALIGTLNLGRGWVGQLTGNLINAKQLSVTDSNGKRTLWVDSYGNVQIDATSLKINANDVGTMINGKVSFSDLSTSGKTTINGGNIQTDTLEINKLKSNNANPIIKLFSNCAIDATANNEMGQGTSIRLKWDMANYLLISARLAGFYNNTGVIYFTSTSEGHACIQPAGGAMIKMLSNYENIVQARNYNDTAYGAFHAADFVNKSSEKYKTNIQDVNIDTLLNVLKANNIKQYNLKEDVQTLINTLGLENELVVDDVDINSADIKIGLILEELTPEAKELLSPENSEGIDIYSMVSLLWSIVQDQQKRIEALEGRSTV